MRAGANDKVRWVSQGTDEVQTQARQVGLLGHSENPRQLLHLKLTDAKVSWGEDKGALGR